MFSRKKDNHHQYYFFHQVNKVIDFLIQQNKEDEFTLLQAEVYGRRILEAKPSDNLVETSLWLFEKPLSILWNEDVK